MKDQEQAPQQRDGPVAEMPFAEKIKEDDPDVKDKPRSIVSQENNLSRIV